MPRRAIALTARQFYNEPYVMLPMRHRIDTDANVLKSVEYGWRFQGRDHSLRLTASGTAKTFCEGSESEFITEHYWGYNAQRNGSTLEYRVELVGNVTPKLPIPLQLVVGRELTLYGSCASCGDYPACLDALASGAISAAPLISAVAPLAEGAAWFERLYRREPGLLKVILKP